MYGAVNFITCTKVSANSADRYEYSTDVSLCYYCITYVSRLILAGVNHAYCKVLFSMHSVDGLWNINDLQYIKLPEVIGAQDVRSILPLGEELWVGAGHWIVVLEKGSLFAKV